MPRYAQHYADYDRTYTPTTLPEAILFAHRWFHDSGFRAFLEGWCAGSEIELPPESLNRDRPWAMNDLVKWARKALPTHD